MDGMQRDNVNVVCRIKDRLPHLCHNLCSKIAFENRILVLLVVCDVIKPSRKASIIQYDIFKLLAVTYRENLPDLLYMSRSQQRFFFFSIWVFFHEHSRFTGQRGKGVIYLTSLFYFHQLHRHLDISRAINSESSLLHIASSRTRTGNLWFPSTSH